MTKIQYEASGFRANNILLTYECSCLLNRIWPRGLSSRLFTALWKCVPC